MPLNINSKFQNKLNLKNKEEIEMREKPIEKQDNGANSIK